MKNRNVYAILFFCLALLTCKEPFAPAIVAKNNSYLVVEGLINTGADSTFIKLSRTSPLEDKTSIKPELGAVVNVEADNNQSYPLKDLGKGVYASAGLNLDPNKKYRLKIKTSNNKTYLSAFVEAKVSPVIDSLSYEVKDDGVQIYSNTHDPSNKSIYYRWEYADAWQFTALNYSLMIAQGGIVRDRTAEEQIFACWGSSNSTNIILGSSAKLEQDVINKAPVLFIAAGSEKISKKYSILVKQYILTKEGFEFWEGLKKNTENLGSIFDAQPSQLIGNIHNVVDADEPVLGFISAGTTQQKRIFIEREKLPTTWLTKYPFECRTDTLRGADVARFIHTNIVVVLEKVPAEQKGGYVTAPKECADCTIRGVTKKPAFWQ